MEFDDIKVDKELKILFMGTPDFSVPVLEGLLKEYKIRAIITQPDHIGKNNQVIFPPVKKVGRDHTILVLQPEKLRESVDEILNLEPDLIITCAYGQILPPEILDYPRLGCINVHASLLPKLRGGAPIHRAILNGYTKTGVTIMYMNESMDQGDIISQQEVEITDTDTASTLHDKLSIIGRDLLLKTLPDIIQGKAKRIPQDPNESTYAFVIKREDERLNFSKSRKEIYNKVRGLNSWPGAYCLFEGKILKIWECYISDRYFPEMFDGQITNIYEDGLGVKVNNGEIVFTVVQQEGKKKMSAVDFVHGANSHNQLVGKILD